MPRNVETLNRRLLTCWGESAGSVLKSLNGWKQTLTTIGAIIAVVVSVMIGFNGAQVRANDLQDRRMDEQDKRVRLAEDRIADARTQTAVTNSTLISIQAVLLELKSDLKEHRRTGQ